MQAQKAVQRAINQNEGMAVELKRNVFKDVGSQHYNAHNSLESFCNNCSMGYRAMLLFQEYRVK